MSRRSVMCQRADDILPFRRQGYRRPFSRQFDSLPRARRQNRRQFLPPVLKLCLSGPPASEKVRGRLSRQAALLRIIERSLDLIV